MILLANLKFKTDEDEYDNTEQDIKMETFITEWFNNYLDTFNT